jgi:Flp pilus assembly protein TadG
MTIRKNLSREKGGNVLIEFALLAPVFFMVIMGLVEFVLYQYKTYALNYVVSEAVRNLQTGEIQVAGNTTGAFLAEMCAHSGMMIDCNAIDYDVRHYSTLSAINFHEPTFNDEGRATNFGFDPGGASDYSVVLASTPHNFVTPFMNELMGITDGKKAAVSSFSIVRNEPWN